MVRFGNVTCCDLGKGLIVLLLHPLVLQLKLITFSFSGMEILCYVKYLSTQRQGGHCLFPCAGVIIDWQNQT